MASVINAIVGNDQARCELVRAQLEFLEENTGSIEQADIAWLVEDEFGQYPKINFLGPIVLVGAAAQTAAQAAPGPVVARAAWPLQYRSGQACLAAAHRAIRANQDPSVGLPRSDLFVGSSPLALEMQRCMTRLAPTNQGLLIQTLPGGASDTVARTIHRISPRAVQEFVPLNCGLIPPDLLESELFGHEQGAFPGALTKKTGRLELAGDGTLFLENIDKLPPGLQSKFMRFLQEGCFEPLGAMASKTSSVRIIASSTQDLNQLVADNLFRHDLMQLFEAGALVVPPLNARPEDVSELLMAAVAEVKSSQGLDVRFTEDAVEHLVRYSWPGDQTELANLVARMSIEFPNSVISSEELPKKFRSDTNVVDLGTGSASGPSSKAPLDLLPLNGIDLKSHIANLEQSLIEQALEDSNAVVARAADRLHIRRTTLVEKMRKYGISRAS